MNPLLSELVGSESSPEVRFTATTGESGFQAEFDCEGLVIRFKGFADAKLTEPAPGSASKKAQLTFGGENNLREEISLNGGFEYLGPFAIEERATVAVKSSAALGIT